MYKLKKLVMFLTVTSVLMILNACSLDGDDGERGLTGEQGPRGEQGQAGQDATAAALTGPFFKDNDQIISDPMLSGPQQGSVRVVWYTAVEGETHRVFFGDLLNESVIATTSKMSQMFEDESSRIFGRSLGSPQTGEAVIEQSIYRHEAHVTGLSANTRVPYYAVSTVNGVDFKSRVYTLQPLPSSDQPVRLLITSDQQNRAMSPANFEKVVETVGMVDAVIFAGDLVDTPNRASEWFYRDDVDRPSFFPAFQGRFQDMFPEHPYRGGEILQHAPIFATIGNHESPGRFDRSQSLSQQDNEPRPRWFAKWQWDQLSESQKQQTGMTEQEYVRTHSYDHVTYYEMWNLPENNVEGEDPENFYSIRYGNISLISMNVSRVWRNWNNGFENASRGKFAEPIETINDLDTWGFGDMFFADYSEGSAQRQWLAQQLTSADFVEAPYNLILTHQSMHGYGDNVIPVMAQPEATIDFTDARMPIVTTFPTDEKTWSQIVEASQQDLISRVRYKYEREKDLWLSVEQELLDAKVNLVVSGHSHVWSRTFVEDAQGEHRLNYIESSNVGNTFGPTVNTNPRATWATQFWPNRDSETTRDPTFWDPSDYPRVGDAHNRPDVLPSRVLKGVDFMRSVEQADQDLPFLSSNNFTVFTILDTNDGTVRSYAHEIAFPQSPAFEVDCFALDTFVELDPC
ncbi:metallophosphoesterase [Ningiella sp. W23]|uniref:metallophosphoesterase n=1 Tax=Ningiella sp. W23 TaxID=3023715 RepID=UPI0037566ED5